MWKIVRRAALPSVVLAVGIAALVYALTKHMTHVFVEQEIEITLAPPPPPPPEMSGLAGPDAMPGMEGPPGMGGPPGMPPLPGFGGPDPMSAFAHRHRNCRR